MHLYLTLSNVYRWGHGTAVMEGILRRVADEGAVLMTSGGSDWVYPTGTAIKEDGGYRVTGRKAFCSQAPVAAILNTAAVYDDPVEGPVVLVMGVPTDSEGFEIIETWDTMGMRATGSHDVQLNDVFVTDAQVVGRRPWGRLDPILRNFLVHISPTASAVSAEDADTALRMLKARK